VTLRFFISTITFDSLPKKTAITNQIQWKRTKMTLPLTPVCISMWPEKMHFAMISE